MSISARQFREYVVKPTLNHLGLYSGAAENLIVLTAAQESHMGRYIKQLGAGPANGICQMEGATHDDIWVNYLEYKRDLAELVRELELPNFLGSTVGSAQEMCGNMYYAVAMCRIHYLRVPEPLPREIDIPALALYWKQHYNTYLGAGTPQEAIDNYRKYGQ